MYIENLQINNFKNFDFFEQEFSTINCIVGNNGVGKTNILDAIYYLSFCRSFHSNNDVNTIKYGKNFFALHGLYKNDNGEQFKFSCSQKKGEKKKFFHDKQPYKKLSEHLGKIPCVILSPYDNVYVNGESSYRRTFMDMIISQTDVVYLNALINYKKSLEQKNHLLKFMQESHYFDALQLDIWNERLDKFAQIIQEKRKEFFESFQKYFDFFYSYVSDNKENPSVEYRTYQGSLLEKMHSEYEKEKVLGYTISGIHRDDILLKLNSHSVQSIGSQGQQKTFTLAMKLAQYKFLCVKKSVTPILLLDDVFDKFDAQRVEKILHLVAQENFGQIFITDTQIDRLQKLIPSSHKEDTTIITL